MTILMAVKDIKLNGKLIHEGEYIRTANPEFFLQREYGRKLRLDETQTILA